MHKFLAFALFTSLVGTVAVSGCDGGETTSGPGGGGGSPTTSTGGTMNTTSTGGTDTTASTGTTTSMPPVCTDVLNETACGACIEEQCCGQLQACVTDADCLFCFLDPQADPEQCAELNDAYSQLVACRDDACPSVCSIIGCDPPVQAPSAGSCLPAAECNLVTNAGCDAASGEVCSLTQSGIACDPTGGQVAACGVCSDAACGPGSGCFVPCDGCDPVCIQYCCEDADCGPDLCAKGLLPDPDIGLCLAAPLEVPCEGGAADGTCDPKKETCGCADCTTTAFCVPGQCTTDGACTIDDSCVCPDCDETATCVCDFDGVCDAFTENCKCTDCWLYSECTDNPHDKCLDNGVCDDFEFCVCTDCKDTDFCLDPNHCTEDGDCAAYEGCVCNDCMSEPTCP